MTEMRVERRLAAIVCADVVGYSRLVGADEAGTIAAWKAHRDVIISLAAAYRGRLVGTQGDGLLFEYASVVDAVAAALVVQQTMADRGAAEPESRRFRLRIGINLGDIIAEGSDILGDGVNVAARLEALAEPGTVCVSGVVREQVLGKLPVEFDDLGARSVKNIDRAVHAWRARPAGSVAPANGARARPPTGGTKPRRRWRIAMAFVTVLLVVGAATAGSWLVGVWPWESAQRPVGVAIMVLPFESSAGQDQEFLSDGITEDIITALSKMAALANRQNLYVIGRSTAFTYKGRQVDARRLARDLSVTHLLVGSVRRDGERLRISAELIDAWTGRSNWAERYDRAAGDVFDIQDDVTAKVVGRLMAMLDTPSGSGDTNPLKPASPGSGPTVADNSPQAMQRRQEAEARARAEEERRRAEKSQDVPPAPPSRPISPPPPPPPSPPDATPSPAPSVPRPAANPRPTTMPRSVSTPVTRPAAAIYDLVLRARLLAGQDARAPLLEARTLLLRAVESEPLYAPAQLALADTYLAAYVRRWDDADGATENLDAAMRAIDATLALIPQSPAAWAMRALTLAHLGRHDEAAAAVDHAVGARDADAATLDRTAQVLLLTGDSRKALALLERARKADPVPSPAAMATQARAEFLLGRDAAAVNTAEACLARAAAAHDCLEIAAAALARQDRLDAARSMLDKLHAIDPSYASDTLRRRFARSYRRAGDIDAVVAVLRKVQP